MATMATLSTIRPRIWIIGKTRKINASLNIALLFCTLLISFYILNLLYFPTQETIKPLNYQIQFEFWGSTNPNKYTAGERESLNAYNVSIISNCKIKKLSLWMDYAKYWKVYYLNVRLYANIVGEDWYFIWDGNVLDALQTAETILKAIDLNNLTNVEGIYFDQEAPYDIKNINVFPNIKRNNEANEIWRQFFIWVNNTFPPNRFIIKTTFFGANIIDIFDHDYDLEVFIRDNIFSVPYFNEYAPMFYEAFEEADDSKVLSVDRANYNLYKWLQITRDGLTTLGLEDEFGVIIGVTNNSILGASVGHIINHKFAGYGYDELVTQSLIVKSFGVRTLTIFTLSSGHDAFGRWGGVFDSYGADFLQKFNESINGVNSSMPFQIPIVYDNDFYQYASLDLWMSIGNELWMVLPIVILFYSIFIILKKNKNK
ncbi:MAG: hypothetical protein ACTSU2_15225 [Promethearchaeota archaeon]